MCFLRSFVAKRMCLTHGRRAWSYSLHALAFTFVNMEQIRFFFLLSLLNPGNFLVSNKFDDDVGSKVGPCYIKAISWPNWAEKQLQRVNIYKKRPWNRTCISNPVSLFIHWKRRIQPEGTYKAAAGRSIRTFSENENSFQESKTCNQGSGKFYDLLSKHGSRVICYTQTTIGFCMEFQNLVEILALLPTWCCQIM